MGIKHYHVMPDRHPGVTLDKTVIGLWAKALVSDPTTGETLEVYGVVTGVDAELPHHQEYVLMQPTRHPEGRLWKVPPEELTVILDRPRVWWPDGTPPWGREA